LAVGFRSYLIKPAATSEVLAVVDEVLDRDCELEFAGG